MKRRAAPRAKDKFIRTKLTDQEYEELRTAAALAMQSVPQYVTVWLRKAAAVGRRNLSA